MVIIKNYFSKVFVSSLILGQLILIPINANSTVPSRIKDIVTFEGIRDNLLVGYGLVVGLNGTGDNLNNSNFTKQGLTEFLGRMGVNIKGANLKTKNVAAVTITSNLHAFARQGSRIDVNVSTIGDAKSLEGGTLLATPILGADGEVYAVAQGPVAISGFKAIGNSGTTISRGVSTNGNIANGAIIEREIDFNLSSLDKVNISLINPDISTAVNIAAVINNRMGENLAKARDPSTVSVVVPKKYEDDVVGLLAMLENIEVRTDTTAKIIIEESSGTVVIGENVKISPVAIAQGNLTIKIEEYSEINQPNPFAPQGAKTKVVPQTKVSIDEGRGSNMRTIDSGTSLRQLVDGLNSLGVTPRDLITILQNIKAVGSLQAEIEVR